MTNIDRYQPSHLTRPAGTSRGVSRGLTRLSDATSLDLARVEATAEVQAVKTDAVTYVANRAMHNVTMVSTLEAQLAQACPQASGRLAMLADVASLSLADLLQQTAHRVRPL